MEDEEEKLTVTVTSRRSQKILNTLREQYLEGIRRSHFKEGTDLTYYPDEDKHKGKGQHVQDKKKFAYNPKFRFRAIVRLVISHVNWMSSAHDEEPKSDDFAFNLRLLRKKKGQLSLLTYKEKMALLKKPSGRTDSEIQLLSEAFAKIRCFRSYEKDIHVDLAKTAILHCFGGKRDVMRKGNPATGLYLITSGEASTLKIHLDCLTLKPSLIPFGSIGPGQLFGEIPLIYDTPRTVSVITLTACEMVFWDKDTFIKVLRDAARKEIDRIQIMMSQFAYFAKWSKLNYVKLSAKAFTHTFERDAAILGENTGEQNTAHFIVNGTCSVIQRVDMVHGKNKKGESFVPYLWKKHSIPPGCFIRTHYFEVAHFRKGMVFNLGESWKNRVVMALTDVLILLVPNNFIEDYAANDNTWEVIKEYINNNLPEEDLFYHEYKQKFIWVEHREKLREDIIRKYKDPKNAEIRNIPQSITHLLGREEIN